MIRDVIQMQILLNRVGSSTTAQTPRASVTCGSRIIDIFFEDRNGRVLEVFDTRTDDIGKAADEVSTGGGESVASDETTVVVKLLLDPIVVKNLSLFVWKCRETTFRLPHLTSFL